MSLTKGGKRRIKKANGCAYTMDYKLLSKEEARYEAHATILVINGQHLGFFAPTSEILMESLMHIGPQITGSWSPARFMHINITKPKK